MTSNAAYTLQWQCPTDTGERAFPLLVVSLFDFLATKSCSCSSVIERSMSHVITTKLRTTWRQNINTDMITTVQFWQQTLVLRLLQRSAADHVHLIGCCCCFLFNRYWFSVSVFCLLLHHAWPKWTTDFRIFDWKLSSKFSRYSYFEWITYLSTPVIMMIQKMYHTCSRS